MIRLLKRRGRRDAADPKVVSEAEGAEALLIGAGHCVATATASAFPAEAQVEAQVELTGGEVRVEVTDGTTIGGIGAVGGTSSAMSLAISPPDSDSCLKRYRKSDIRW